MIVHGNTAPDAELVVLYGNCQTTYLAVLLAAADPSRAYGYVLNHAIPGEELAVPSEQELRRCVLYLEQYDSEPYMLVRETLRQRLPAGCPRLIFPTFMMFCLWPFEHYEPRAHSEPGFPWGRYPHGDAVGLELAALGLAGDDPFEAYMRLSRTRMPDLQQRLQGDIERILRHDRASDVTIGDYVIPRFRREHLFWTTGHVSSDAISELARRLRIATLPLLGDADAALEKIDVFAATFAGMGSVQLPIHPQVARELELAFYDEDMTFEWFGNHWRFREYVPRYIAYDNGWQLRWPQVPSPQVEVEAEAAPVDIHQADMQINAARHLRWMPENIQVIRNEVVLEGWVLTLWEPQEALRFLINGQDFEETVWPIASPDLRAPFGALPNAGAARFRCRQPVRDGEHPFQDGFIRFAVTGRFGEHRRSYRTSWYHCDPAREAPAPSAAQIRHATGDDRLEAFRLGGATMAQRIRHLLPDRFDRPLESFDAVLDLGCGAGRLSRYLHLFCRSLTGADFDADNIASCAQAIPSARFTHIDRNPPLPFADASFDLVIGIAALNHCTAPEQRTWLAELQRIVSPGGLVLLSITGMAQAALLRASTESLRALHSKGMLCADATNDARWSHDYVRTRWEEHFDVLDIIEAIAGNQDLVVMRRRAGAAASDTESVGA